MLAQLDKVEGVAESRVDWTGRYFLLKIAPGRNPEGVATLAISTLKGARRLTAAQEAEQVAAYRRGEPWMRAGETLKLSQYEARVLAERFGDEAARKSGLDADQSRRLKVLIEEELSAAFQRVQGDDAQLVARFRKEWPVVVRRIAERSRDFTAGEQRNIIVETLEDCFQRRGK